MRRCVAVLAGPALLGLVIGTSGCGGDDPPVAPSTTPAGAAATVDDRMPEDEVAVLFGSEPPSSADIAAIERQLDEIDQLLDGLDSELTSD